MSDRRPWARRGFLTATAGAVASAGAWNARSSTASAEVSARSGRAGSALRPFPLDQVRLRPGPFLEARDRNSRYLLSMPQDRLLRSFRVNAGLPAAAEPLGGWEKPDCELRGHFTGGHYLSACAL